MKNGEVGHRNIGSGLLWSPAWKGAAEALKGSNRCDDCDIYLRLVLMPRKEPGGLPISAQAQQELVSEGIENFELPKTVVTKIAKSALPDNAKLQKETVLALVKGSTVFINYLGGQVNSLSLTAALT